jgi:hypothetical protein
MKSCLGLILSMTAFVVVIGGGFLIWYLSQTADFSRTDPAAGAAAPAMPERPPDGQ